MTPVVAAVLTGALVVGGKYARGDSPTIQNAIGVGGIAIGLAILDQMNSKFASAFGVLIVVAVAIVHFPAIAKATGLAEIK